MFVIAKNWYELLKEEFNKEYYINLTKFLNRAYNDKIIYPEPKNVYNALNLVKFEDVKVVIIGQDPYHNPNQAHGLSFSVDKDIKLPPSLINIFKELSNDIGCYLPNNGNLTKWAKQGVLLLNSVLTVEENKPNSHKNMGWEKITTKIIQLLNVREKPVVFLLWGANAKSIGKDINLNKHYVLSSSHPSPMSANQGGWFNNHHFSKTNSKLIEWHEAPIDWQIENI